MSFFFLIELYDNTKYQVQHNSYKHIMIIVNCVHEIYYLLWQKCIYIFWFDKIMIFPFQNVDKFAY